MIDGREKWTLDWVRDRIRFQHHRVLTRYLCHRTSAQAIEAYATGLTPDDIIQRAFNVVNGHTAVPQDALRLLLREDLGVHPRTVYNIFAASSDKRQMRDFLDKLEKRCRLKPEFCTPDIQAVIDLAKTFQIMKE